MTNPVRFGLIGVGGIGAYHRAAIEAHESAGVARLVAVADPWAERLAAQKADLESRGVRWHMDYRDLLRDETEMTPSSSRPRSPSTTIWRWHASTAA
jgi:predicted dehydrogenase